ncbi:retrovirus-related Pol polyprotein from transposon opus [Trichonephila clavipes]|nr:retrovirus-related Pol polyprotein from transposon opus [Trichonephila clavipes]
MAFLEKAKKQDLVLLGEELGQKVSDKMTIIDLKNIIIGSKDYEEEFVRAQLFVISEERVERETEEKIARQHAIQQLRWESEFNELRLEIESIRSNVKRTSCAEDRKKTSSNYRISIGRAEEHMRETSSAVLMAEATIIEITRPYSAKVELDDGGIRELHFNKLRPYIARVGQVGLIFDQDSDFGDLHYAPTDMVVRFMGMLRIT